MNGTAGLAANRLSVFFCLDCDEYGAAKGAARTGFTAMGRFPAAPPGCLHPAVTGTCIWVLRTPTLGDMKHPSGNALK
jgi:hypothetical protein